MRVMTDEERAASDEEARLHMEAVDNLHRRVRFDVEIPAGLVGEEYALEILLAQLPEQMMAWTERNVDFNDPKSVGRGWFAIDRNSDEGIAGGAKIIVEPPL